MLYFSALDTCHTLVLDKNGHMTFGIISTPSQCKSIRGWKRFIMDEAPLTDHLSYRKSWQLALPLRVHLGWKAWTLAVTFLMMTILVLEKVLLAEVFRCYNTLGIGLFPKNGFYNDCELLYCLSFLWKIQAIQFANLNVFIESLEFIQLNSSSFAVQKSFVSLPFIIDRLLLVILILREDVSKVEKVVIIRLWLS